MKKALLFALIFTGCASPRPSSQDARKPQSVDPNSYPAYPLRADLGEVLQPNEKEDVALSASAVETLIMARMKKNGLKGRGDHSTALGCFPAKFEISNDLSNDQEGQGFVDAAWRGMSRDAIIRYSNGDTPDVSDMRAISRGFAVKIKMESADGKGAGLSDSDFLMGAGARDQDFLAASAPTFMVKDIHQYAYIFDARNHPNLKNVVTMGVQHPKMMIDRVVKPMLRTTSTAPVLLEERFWGRLPSAWGSRAGKFSFIPCHDVAPDKPGKKAKDQRYQPELLKTHLEKSNICYRMVVQLRPLEISPELGEKNKTLLDQYFPIEDATVRWPDEETPRTAKIDGKSYDVVAPYKEIGRLVVARGTPAMAAQDCERTSFNPWNALKAHQPLSSLARARFAVYSKSKETRFKIYGDRDPAGEKREAFHGEISKVISTLSDPENLKTAATLGIRYDRFVEKNLYDTGVDPADPKACETIMSFPHRTADGVCYFKDQKIYQDMPNMGARTERFGRNSAQPKAADVEKARKNLLEPNPRLVSKELFERKDGKTIPATTLNLLAASWLQAENHDWFSHGKNVTPHSGQEAMAHGAPPSAYDFINVPAVPGDETFPNGMKLPRTRPDLSKLDRNGYPVTFRNVVTHWWDASQIYGSDAETIRKVRSNPKTGELLPGGMIAVDEANRRLYYDENGIPITGFTDNWWVGLEMFHSLFAMEHNAVARMIKEKHPDLSDDLVFEKARLTVAALIAKIHTTEWTPALLDNKLLHIGMYANWYGIKKVENPTWRKIIRSISSGVDQSLNGLVTPGVPALHDVPFTLTEEFVAVYRMHPLLPEEIDFKAIDGSDAHAIPITQTTFGNAGKLINSSPTESRDVMYSFLTSHPGAMTLNNFPKFMQFIDIQRNTEGVPTIKLDMGTMDVLRDRERLVPRYNDFRRSLGLKAPKNWAELTPNKEFQDKLERVYGGDIEKMDLLVGTLAENDRLEGFAFGVTPFSIFQLMASRRLASDPFFRDYYTPEVYTAEGLKWIDDNTMIDVITRHYPELKPHMEGVVNAFHPWH